MTIEDSEPATLGSMARMLLLSVGVGVLIGVSVSEILAKQYERRYINLFRIRPMR